MRPVFHSHFVIGPREDNRVRSKKAVIDDLYQIFRHALAFPLASYSSNLRRFTTESSETPLSVDLSQLEMRLIPTHKALNV